MQFQRLSRHDLGTVETRWYRFDGSEIWRENHPGMVLKPVVNHGISTIYLSLNWWKRDFWTIICRRHNLIHFIVLCFWVVVSNYMFFSRNLQKWSDDCAWWKKTTNLVKILCRGTRRTLLSLPDNPLALPGISDRVWGARNLNWKMRRCGLWTLSRRWDREFDPFLFESIGIMEGISMCEKFIHS